MAGVGARVAAQTEGLHDALESLAREAAQVGRSGLPIQLALGLGRSHRRSRVLAAAALVHLPLDLQVAKLGGGRSTEERRQDAEASRAHVPATTTRGDDHAATTVRASLTAVLGSLSKCGPHVQTAAVPCVPPFSGNLPCWSTRRARRSAL